MQKNLVELGEDSGRSTMVGWWLVLHIVVVGSGTAADPYYPTTAACHLVQILALALACDACLVHVISLSLNNAYLCWSNSCILALALVRNELNVFFPAVSRSVQRQLH